MTLVRRAVILSTCAIALTGLTAAMPAVATTKGCGRWTVQARSQNVILSGVTALSARDAWAVGVSFAFAPVALRWNGHAWLQVPSPAISSYAGFDAASATSGRDAWAVGWAAGGGQTLTEHWDGTQFIVVPSPSPGTGPGRNILRGVAATSARNAWAVGIYSFLGPDSTRTLILHWNGLAWLQVPSPNPARGKPGGSPPVANSLQGVAALSATDAWAVGSNTEPGIQSKTLIVHWNGHTWKRAQSPNPTHASELTALSATSARNVWAVGSYFDGHGDQTLIEHWNGRSWTRVPSPDPAGFWHGNTLTGVTAISARDAWAVGSYRSHGVDGIFILHWNGSTWKKVATPTPDGVGGADELNAVAAASVTNVWAVGAGYGRAGHQSITLHC